MRKPAIEALQEASALFVAGRLEEARRACRKLLAKRPDIAEAHVLMGEVHRQSGDQVRARECDARALKLRPGWNEAHLHLTMGDMFADFQRFAEAEARYRAALAADPRFSDARYNLAGALHAAGRGDEAITELRALIESQAGAADAREQLVRLLQEHRRFEEMEAVCRVGMTLHPAASFYPNKLGVALWWRGRHEDALAAYRLAAERAGSPGGEQFAAARFLEASGLLTLGRYAEGWEAFRWRPTRRLLRASHPELLDDPSIVAATGTPKRLRIVSEQGLGDELFFLRFAPALRERGHSLFVSCSPKLAALLSSRADLFADINAPQERTDLTLASGDLPLASGQPIAPPLELPVDVKRRDAIAERLRAFGPPPYIAVTWRAGVLPDEAKPGGVQYWTKEIPPDLLGRSLRSVDARVIIVQRRPQAEEARRFTEGLGRAATDLSAVNDDLRDAVALLSFVDQYVGVSNTNMHLRAGVHGKPARVLVLMPPEWRWGLQGSASQWFPGFILYRRTAARDWENALAQLETDLAADGAAMQQA